MSFHRPRTTRRFVHFRFLLTQGLRKTSTSGTVFNDGTSVNLPIYLRNSKDRLVKFPCFLHLRSFCRGEFSAKLSRLHPDNEVKEGATCGVMGALRQTIPIGAADVFRSFQYQARFARSNRFFLEGAFRYANGGNVCNFCRRTATRRRRFIISSARIIHVNGKCPCLLSGLANIGLVFRRRDNSTHFHVAVGRHPISKNYTTVLQGRKDVRIRNTRSQRIPCRLQRRTRDGSCLRVNLPYARHLRGDLVLRLLQLGGQGVVFRYVLLRQEGLRFVSPSNELIKRHGSARRVMTSFCRTAGDLRHGIKDARVCGPRVLLFRRFVCDLPFAVCRLQNDSFTRLRFAVCGMQDVFFTVCGTPSPQATGDGLWVMG